MKLVTERGMTCVQSERDLDIGQNFVSRWVREAKADKTHALRIQIVKSHHIELRFAQWPIPRNASVAGLGCHGSG